MSLTFETICITGYVKVGQPRTCSVYKTGFYQESIHSNPVSPFLLKEFNTGMSIVVKERHRDGVL